MQRTFSTMLAAIMAAGMTMAVLGPASAAPVRAVPALEQSNAGAGVEQIRHRRQWHDNHHQKRWRAHKRHRHWQHRRYQPRVHFGFPYFVPPRHNFYFYDQPRRRNWR